ncbi:MAG: hypothetical protein V7739_19080 [Motiliproteus sp.]
MNRCDIARSALNPLEGNGYGVVRICVLIALLIAATMANAGSVVDIRYGHGLSTYHPDKYSHSQGYRNSNKYKYYKNRHNKSSYYDSKYGRKFGSQLRRNYRADDRYRGYMLNPYYDDRHRYKNRKHNGSSGNVGIYYRSGKGSFFYQVPLEHDYNNGSYLDWD